jgi:KDO2-lipid IV(A) lauroyltransferase
MPRRPPRRTRLARAGWRALIAVTRALPWRARLGFAGFMGRTAVRIVPRLRDRIAANLAEVMPEMTDAKRARVTRDCGDSFGRTFVEILCNPEFHARATWTGPSGPGAAVIEAAAREGRGAVLVTGHFGQWEAGRAWMKARGINCAGVYRPLDDPALNELYLASLEFGGRPIFAKGPRGVRGIVAHLARGGIVAILTDQYDRRGATLDFLGRPAPTSTIAPDLALKYRVPLVPIYGVRAADGEHVAVVVEAPIPPSTPREMMQAVNDSLAAQVRAHPGQYYWLHQRWVKRPGAHRRRRAKRD